MPKDLPEFGEIVIPKDKEVPLGAVTPAPVKVQKLHITSPWRIYRPVIDHEKCTRCLNCDIYCPDACWEYNEEKDEMELNLEFCKGCLICIEVCPAKALTPVHELEFEGGVVRLDNPF